EVVRRHWGGEWVAAQREGRRRAALRVAGAEFCPVEEVEARLRSGLSGHDLRDCYREIVSRILATRMPIEGPIPDLGRHLRDYWHGRDIDLNPGASEGAIAGFETAHGVRLPTDIRSYFAAADGMRDHDADDMLFAWSGLQQVA